MLSHFLRSVLASFGFGPPIETISPQDAYEGSCTGEVVLIDVRDADEWEQTGTPSGSHRIAMTDKTLSEKVRWLMRENPNASIAVGCATGRRSKTVIRRLHQSGIEGLKVLSGGMDRWSNEGLPVDR